LRGKSHSKTLSLRVHIQVSVPLCEVICVTHVLDSFTDADLANSEQVWAHAFPGEVEQEVYLEAVRSDPISSGHDIVRAIHASGLCWDEFLDTLKTGNLKNWFKGCAGEAVQVPELELLHDVKSCWDSSCIMINHLWASSQYAILAELLFLAGFPFFVQALDYFLVLPNQ
ncbi:hypothetical protein PISMIDRAFT_642102, partial [Pisolithus microcarpus 441]